MKLSTRNRYSTRLMFELALNYNKGPIFLRDISNTQQISYKYLSQLVIPLKVAGLLKSIRGAHGGYFLAKPPEEIKLSDIILAVEGTINTVECIDNPEICTRADDCITRDIWEEISDRLSKILSSYNLQIMIDLYFKKHK
ncbi:MAG: RrF2 family transcriptional regulator [Candidatus Humimicrobiaceae bacterium]